MALNTLGKFPKKPAAIKRYVADFSEWLDTGETVTAKTFAVAVSAGVDAGPDLAVDSSSIISSSTQVAFFVSGGLVGVTYQITLHITTSASQEEDFEIFFVIRE
jgi:hypothetical protein